MLKRPGGKFISKLDGATAGGKWFPILRDGLEKYIGQYDPTTFNFRAWQLSDGAQVTVDMSASAGQPSTCNIADVLAKTQAVATAKNTLKSTEQALQAAASTLAKTKDGQIPSIKKVFATDFRQLSNPRAQDFTDKLTERLKSGVLEVEGTALRAKAEVTDITSVLSSFTINAAGAGYQTPAMTINGSGSNAAGSLTLKSKGTFAGIEITNPGEGYAQEPIITLTGDLAPLCNPKCIMSGPSDTRFADPDVATKVTEIQLNPGKEIKLYEAISCSSTFTDAQSINMDTQIDHQGGQTTYTKSEAASQFEVFCLHGGSHTHPHMGVFQRSGTGWMYPHSHNFQQCDNVRMPTKYLSTDNNVTDTLFIVIKPQDLTNVHTIRVYGMTGAFSSLTPDDQSTPNVGLYNGLVPPAFDNTLAAGFFNDEPEWATLTFEENTNWPFTAADTTGTSYNVTPTVANGHPDDRFLLRDANYPEMHYEAFTGPSNNVENDNFPVDFLNPGESFDDVITTYMPKTIRANDIPEKDKRYGYTDVPVPAKFRKANVAMYIRGCQASRFAWSTMHLLEDLPAEIGDNTITITTNPIKTQKGTSGVDANGNAIGSTILDAPDPTTAATARILVAKGIESATVTATGDDYQKGVATTAEIKTALTDSINITNGGTDYEVAPTVTISGGGGVGATATATLTEKGRFKRFAVVGGSGYTSVPTVTLGGSLAGRTATATISNGAVTSITLDPNTVDCTTNNDFLNTVNSNISGHRPAAGVAVTAGGNGTARRNLQTKVINQTGTGFNIGTHLYFGADVGSSTTPSTGVSERWIVTKGFNTTLTDKIRVKAIFGSEDTFAQNGGLNERIDERSNNDNWQNLLGVFGQGTDLSISTDGMIQCAYCVRSTPFTSDDIGDTGDLERQHWTAFEQPVARLINRKVSGHTLVDYFTDLPEEAKAENVHFAFLQSSNDVYDQQLDQNNAHLSGNTNLHTSEVGITEIEFIDTVDYELPTSIRDNATVAITGGGGSNAAATPVWGFQVDKVNVTSVGSGFTGQPGITFTAGLASASAVAQPLFFGSGATVTPTFTQTFTSSITEPGKGYVTASATLSGGGGSGATATVSTDKGFVSGITVTGGDGLYTSNPNITISDPDLPGTETARFVVKKDGAVLNGAANFVSIKKSGQGLTAPSATNVITTTNGDGINITVDLTVTNGQVTAATVNTNGTGYWTGDELYPAGYSGVVLAVEGIAKGTERTNEHPVLASTGVKIFEAEETFAPTHTAAQLTTAETAYNTALTTNTGSETALDTARTNLTAAQALCAISSQPGPTLLITSAGSGFTNGPHTAVQQSGSSLDGVSGGLFDIVVTNGAITSATYNSANTKVYRGDDVISLTGFAGATLTAKNEWYLKDATIDDIEVLTVNDYTFVVNKKREVKMSAKKTHTNVDPNRACVVVQVASNSTLYQVNLTRDVGGTPTTHSASTTSASSSANSSTIANDLGNAINNLGQGYSANAIGPSIVITHADPFKMSIQGGISSEAIFGFTDSISNVSLLPLHCKDGYVVKVTNAADVDIDDWYVEFTANNGAGFGVGQWTETTEPGTHYQIDPTTMPHALVNPEGGKFELRQITWNDRIVGDVNTNPAPSFVDNKISNVFFYRGRMGLLSGQNVILSQAQDIFNFWAQTARTSTAADPIDVSAIGKKPVFLNYVQPTSVGLVLYSSNEQFVLTTDADVLTPTSTKINQLSSYECDSQVEAVGLGTSQAFVTKTPLFTRIFELNDINADQPPVMSDITNVVPELIPASVDSLAASPALSIVSVGQTGTSDIYQYRFLSGSRDERLLNSWYRWSLTGNLQGQFFDSSTWFAVVNNGADIYVQSFDMTQSNEQGFLTLPTGEKTDVCLDLFHVNPHRTYDSATDKTRIFLPYNDVAGSELNAVVLGGYIGDSATTADQSVGSVIKPATGITAQNVAFTDLDGDLRGRDVIIGFNYNMEIELPELYKYSIQGDNVTNDDVSSLILHRLKFKTGLSGPIDYKVSITGREDWDNAVSVTQPNQYQLNNVNMQAQATHVVPVFQRNENLAVKIIGNTPFPVSLLGLDWEGKFNQRFYRRG